MSLPNIVSFWHGPISWLERLSIRSFLRRGHPVAVYAYAPIPALPVGAEWRDAAAILPEDQLVFYKGKGTPAVFSDRFRLELLRHGKGVYSDLDVYCIEPIAAMGPYLMAYEKPGSVNNAVLYIEPDAPLLADLINVFSADNRAFWLPYLTPLRRMEVVLRRLAGERLAVENMQFGASGPMPLTYFVRKHGLEASVLSSTSFYPVPYKEIPSLMRPSSSVDPFLKSDTIAIHLWRSQLTDRGRAAMPPPPPGSALSELCSREDIDPFEV